MASFETFRAGHCNPGQRPIKQIADFVIAALKGEDKYGLDERPVDVMGLDEIRDRLPGLRTRIEAAGLGFIEGPDVTDGRKIGFAYNPELVRTKGELCWVRTAPMFWGRRFSTGDKRRRMGNRIVLAQEFVQLSTGRSPWIVEGHTIPSNAHPANVEKAYEDNVNTAKLLRELRGSVVCYKDWNGEWDKAPRTKPELFQPIRDLQEGPKPYTILPREFSVGGTFDHGDGEIDWGLVRESSGFDVTGQKKFWLPGVEATPGKDDRGHALIVADIKVRVIKKS